MRRARQGRWSLADLRRAPQGIQKKRPSEAQSALLRRQLLELTQSFIIPLVSRVGEEGGGCGRERSQGTKGEQLPRQLL